MPNYKISSLTLLKETQDLSSATSRKPRYWPLSFSDQRGCKSWVLHPSPGISRPSLTRLRCHPEVTSGWHLNLGWPLENLWISNDRFLRFGNWRLLKFIKPYRLFIVTHLMSLNHHELCSLSDRKPFFWLY